MTQPARGAPHPSSRPTTVGAPKDVPTTTLLGSTGEKPASEAPGPQKPAENGAGLEVKKPEPSKAPAVASLDWFDPAMVWKLAVWAVTNTTDDDDAADRRAEVRSVLLALVDRIAPERAPNATSGTNPLS